MSETCWKAFGYMIFYSGGDGDTWQAVGLTPVDVEVILACRKVLAEESPEQSFIESGRKERWCFGKNDGYGFRVELNHLGVGFWYLCEGKIWINFLKNKINSYEICIIKG